jgi:hypothetical protein
VGFKSVEKRLDCFLIDLRRVIVNQMTRTRNA